ENSRKRSYTTVSTIAATLDAERWRSPAAGSVADAVGSQVQCVVRRSRLTPDTCRSPVLSTAAQAIRRESQAFVRGPCLGHRHALATIGRNSLRHAFHTPQL